ncbi:fas apoptotic inhibitory molecule 2b isoform X1 [Oryzias melastigma]|uniref:fas apoptotic inhibitory molecule 2b isoform X1 n=1 Tax=Oryzias melastigma TaxID=30732 RepID=UPI00168D7F6F|nr:fas apoptotic inhibitory molecule 2b isoform X1 [Oryzias melastigma]XP_036067764.1 fas apoptotic inhibitory molecule 2b isoform X1 [Oryzias melastigma]
MNLRATRRQQQVMVKWRPSSPGTTRPSGGLSSERCTPSSCYSCPSPWGSFVSSRFGKRVILCVLHVDEKRLNYQDLVCVCFSAPVRFYIQTHPNLYMMSYLMFFVTYILLSCCGDLRRQFPWNALLLVLFTLSMAFMMGFVSSFYNTKSVILCLGITALVCLSVTIFSFQSKVDVTSCQGVLFSMCMAMLLCAITISIVVPFGYVPWLHAIYAVIGAILFTLFLAFDTQLLLGNKRYAISPEEYIFATLSLYLDIIYLFSFLLQLLGGGRE